MNKQLDWYYDPRGTIVKAEGTDGFSMYKIDNVIALVEDYRSMSYSEFKNYVQTHKKALGWVMYGVL